MRVVMFLILFSTLLSAQEAELSGRVVSDTDNAPLIGATIFSSIDTTVSDLDGNFVIAVKIPDALFIQYVGFQADSFPILGLSNDKLYRLSPSNNILETAVISASMTEQNLATSTVSLEVIKPELISRNNSQSLDDVLNLLPGVEIIDGQASIRGGSGYAYGAGSRVLLLIDNIPALQPDAGFPNWNDIALENVAQIEVVKGAASALYGSSALNGVINVRYAQPSSTPTTLVSLNSTVFGAPSDVRRKWWDIPPYAYGGHLLHRRKIGKFDLTAGAQYYQLESFRNETFQKRGRILINSRYRVNGRTTFGLNVIGNLSDNASYVFWENGLRGSYLPFEGSEVRSFNNRWIFDPQFTHFDQWGNRHRVQSRIYYTDNGAANGLDNFSLLTYGEYQFQKQFTKWRTSITAGVSATRVGVNAGLYGGATYGSVNSGVYIQVDKEVGSNIQLSFGSRYEYNRLQNSGIFILDGSFVERVEANDVQEGKPIFRFGANYRISSSTFLRASIGQGYRFPTIAEKFTTVGLANFRIFTNENLESETGWSSEIGFKQGFKLGSFYGYLDGAAFWSEYNNMMEFSFTAKSGVPGFQSSNVGDTRIRGLDLNMAGTAGPAFLPVKFLIGYTFLDPRYIAFSESIEASSSVDYNILKYRSQHNIKADLEVEAFDASVGGNLRYVSHMAAIDEQFNLFIPGLRNFRSVNDQGYFLLNLRTSYRLGKHKFSFLIGNVLNAAYTVRPALLEAPRSFSLRYEASI